MEESPLGHIGSALQDLCSPVGVSVENKGGEFSATFPCLQIDIGSCPLSSNPALNVESPTTQQLSTFTHGVLENHHMGSLIRGLGIVKSQTNIAQAVGASKLVVRIAGVIFICKSEQNVSGIIRRQPNSSYNFLVHTHLVKMSRAP